MPEGADPPGRKAGGHQVDAPREWMPLARGKDKGGEPRRGGPRREGVYYTPRGELLRQEKIEFSVQRAQKSGNEHLPAGLQKLPFLPFCLVLYYSV